VASRQPAPAPLNVVADFVNTYEIDGDERDERLVTAAALRTWLVERGLLEAGYEPTDAELALAVRVREDLRALLLANNGEELEPGPLERLNDVAARSVLNVHFTGPGDAHLQSAATGMDGALGRILAIVLVAMGNGTWARLKACRNDECMWVFYDTSKNHSATWCSMRVCGNRMKARAYRRRRAEEHA
jgi:predicted RNA-binding Zn ribbon-like protein